MNIEDAIRIIRGVDTSNSEENIEAKKMAVKALEKQRQKKIMLPWQSIRLTGRQARSFIGQHTKQES